MKIQSALHSLLLADFQDIELDDEIHKDEDIVKYLLVAVNK
jgi:hypothetical protein